MKESFETIATVRDDEALNQVIRSAITEVIETFGGDMTERDRQMLLSVANEKSTKSVARVIYLTQTPSSTGVSDNYSQFVNQVLETLRQTLTLEEKELFRGGFGGSVLNDIP